MTQGGYLRAYIPNAKKTLVPRLLCSCLLDIFKENQKGWKEVVRNEIRDGIGVEIIIEKMGSDHVGSL